MFTANVLRLGAIALIIAVGIAVATGIGAVSSQIRSAPEYGSLTREQVLIIGGIADKVELLGNVLPPFFIFISALTALATVTRLVEEERPAFACYKTLGYSNFSIIFRYTAFASVCAVIGCIIGLAVGNFLLRPAIFNVVKIKFDIPDTSGIFLTQGLIWSAAMSAAILLTAFFVSFRQCKEKPAELLRAKSPKAGKKIFLEYMPFLWKKMKFKSKSSLRNIFRFKGRLIMTALSAAGATVMLFVGLGLLASISGSENEKIQDLSGLTDSMNVIAVIVTVCGIALSALVLFNLTNINIEERKREIATLKVLGYKPIETAGFIYRELAILSIIGIALGLPSGYYFVGFLFDYLEFGSLDLIEWYVWIVVTVIAVLSVILADILLYGKINKIEMHKSLKTIE
jgi:putative ABC transport system permease protein